MDRISGTTGIIALLGYPVAHSLSPFMHNLAFRERGLDYCYVALPVEPRNLGDAVRGLRALGIRGANVTVPHKERIMALLDSADDGGWKIGAVNTLVIDKDGIHGSNTDAQGFIRAWQQEMGLELEGRKALIIGAGGSAKAVYYGLGSQRVSDVHLYTRTEEKAHSLHRHFQDLFPGLRRGVVPFDDYRSLEEILGTIDVIINCSPAGLAEDISPLPCLQAVKAGALIYDLIYRPSGTVLVREARRKGLHACNGLGMLINQGALSFQTWTGVPFPLETIRRIIEEKSGQ